jgi:hypothetical protein
MATSRRSGPKFAHPILLEDEEVAEQPNPKHDEIQSSGPSPPAGYPTSYSSPQRYGGVSQSPPGSHGSLPRPPSQPEPTPFVPAGPGSPSSASSGSFAGAYASHEPGGVSTPYTYMTPTGLISGQVSSRPSPPLYCPFYRLMKILITQ